MGATAHLMAFVDPDCRVIGVDRLRLTDCSISPLIANGKLNAPSVTTEEAADHILDAAHVQSDAMDAPRAGNTGQSSERLGVSVNNSSKFPSRH